MCVCGCSVCGERDQRDIWLMCPVNADVFSVRVDSCCVSSECVSHRMGVVTVEIISAHT